MAGHGGGAWKVAYADFVTAMMAFFLVMWITAQNKQVKVAVAHYFNAPFNSMSKTKGPQPAGAVTTGPLPPGSDCLMPSKTPGDPPGVIRSRTAPRTQGRRVADPGSKPLSGGGTKKGTVDKPASFVLHNGDRQTDCAVIPFADASSELNERGKKQLELLVPLLLGKRHKIEIRGHAKRAATAEDTGYDPWQLSYARCVAVLKYLEEAGIESERIRLSQAGVFEPHTIREDIESQARNSCADVFVLEEFAEDSFGSREERDTRYKTP